ncbi:MAG TPA: TA system VapC family ribonuclease toxin [Blastocatellia bacterium]|nr:TA system VapC family ribonuclease toxin [Blastocatellia bacterium]
MKLIDANLLLYAHSSSSPHHQQARVWLEDVFSKPEPVRLAWMTILAFLRISTDSRSYKHPFSTKEAMDIVSDWLTRPNVEVLEPGERHLLILGKLLSAAHARGAVVMDAHLAALAIEHGAVVCTNDKDFSRFPGLRVLNPIEETN